MSQQGRPQPYIIALTAHALEGDRHTRVSSNSFSSPPCRNPRLRLALDVGELDMINDVTHALGSVSASLGAAALTHRCRTLEEQIRQGGFVETSSSERQALIQDFERDVDHLQMAFTRLLRRLDYD